MRDHPKNIFVKILIALLVTVTGLKAQLPIAISSGASISGIITDGESDMVLPFVNVLLLQTDSTGCETDRNGVFNFNKLTPGNYRIRASYLGYQTFESDLFSVTTDLDTFMHIQLSPSFVQSQQVVITATRKSQTLVSAPVSVDVVSSKDLEAMNTVTFDEAFNGVTGVDLTRSSKSNVQALSIRGASEVAGGGVGNRVLLLIDGRPALSPDSGGALWNLVPVNSIEKIEIVKGAYSSLFGSSAMGGVINVITKEPKESYNTKVSLRYGFYNKAPAYTGYDRFNDFNSIDISHSNRFNDKSYLLEFSKKHDDGHREKASFDLYNLYGKYHWKISNEKSLKLSGNYNKISNDTPATWLSSTESYTVADFRKDDFQEKDEFNADIFYSVIRNADLKYTSRLYYYRNDAKFSFNDDIANDSTNVNIGKQIIGESSIMSERWGNVTQIDFTKNEKHYMIGGIEGSYDKIVALPDSVLYGRQRAYNVGVYFQDEYYIHEKLTATAGVRYDYYGVADNFMESNISPKISLVYNPHKKLSIRTLFGQAFRNPSIAERFIKYEQGGGLQFIPNPGLKSEKLHVSFELGSRYQLADKGIFDIAFFYNQYNNLISYQQIPNTQGALIYQVINLNEAVIKGLETSLSYSLKDNWNIRLAYTYLDAKDTSPNRLNDALAYKRKHSINLNNSVDYKMFSLHVNGVYKSQIDEVFIYPGSEPDGYFLLNSRLDAQISDRYRAFFAIDNIGDAQYEEIERYRMAGRSFTLGVTMNISE